MGFTALAQGVNLTVVTVTQHAIVGDCQVAYGMLCVAGKLLGFSTDGVFIDVECPVLFAQVEIGVAIGCPAGCAILAVEVGEFGELAGLLQPDVASDGTRVMFAEGILIALDVMVEDVAAAVDAQVLHRQF